MAFAYDFQAMIAAAMAVSPPPALTETFRESPDCEGRAPAAPPSARGSGMLDRASQRVGLVLAEKALSILAPKGATNCNAVMQTLDVSLARPASTNSIAPAADALSSDARLILRARCGACPDRCTTPLL